ncbi:MAG: methyltransferase domain-containing protein, partial [Propionicimonas sp.]|nr:methyltransferase domain-containing protein [Propionicimonas sp.]
MTLQAADGLLACPHCGGRLTVGDRVACPRGHNFDIARQGYLNLLGGPQPKHADTPAMVAARRRVLSSGAFDRILNLVAEHSRRAPRVLEVGSGTAQYLRGALGEDPSRCGVALDISTAAAKVAAKADQRIAAVVADVWGRLPLLDHCVDEVLCVFAPRNLAEFARILAPGGRLVVLAPNPGHLAGLRARYGLLGIEADKQERLLASTSEFFERTVTSRLLHSVELPAELAGDVVAMG